jgi:protein-histidine pros-kinase
MTYGEASPDADTSRREGAQALLRRVLLTVFIASEIFGAGGFYLLLRHQAALNAEQQARVLLASALAVRRYTSDRIKPQFDSAAGGGFREETVPSFAAQTVFRSVSNGAGAYSYREAALNPTSPQDRAMPVEVELIKRFAADPSLTELKGMRDVADERVFYLARPLRITDAACLACHSTPAAAPPSLLAKYGASNGFGWRLNETVGVQFLAIPVTAQFRQTLTSVAILCGGLMVVFAAAYFALSRSLARAFVLPLRDLAAAADQASRDAEHRSPMPGGGVSEVRDLAAAVERLRTSLRKALSRLAAIGPPDAPTS